tara:strand:- start:314 stop:709 length:396 start_codon:yes stop_codon:yes gene_type:complete
MAFKLGSSRGFEASRGNIKSKLKFKSGSEVIPGTPVFVKKLEDGVLAEANMDGSIYVSKDYDLDTPMMKYTMNHEMQHLTKIRTGEETYDDDHVYFNGEVWQRDDGYVIDPRTGKKYIEGDKDLPWEANKI